MAVAPDAIVLLGVGLAGSVHCIAMCGGFAGALATSRGPGAPRARLLADQALFHGGKIATYAFLGAMAGALGAGLAGSTGLAIAQRALAGLSGAILVGVGARLALGGRRAAAPARAAAPIVPRPLERGVVKRAYTGALATALRAAGPAAPFASGLLVGFIPCGLVYAALATAAASASALDGALLMAAFGVGTAPALLVTAGGARAIAAGSAGLGTARSALARAGGALAVGLGLLTLVRGAIALAPAGGAAVACPGCG